MWSSYAIESGVVIYRSDANKIGTRVVGADPDSFRSLERDPCLAGGYARDRNAVYYEGVKVPGADPQSFEPSRDTYAKDRAWWYGAGVPLASRQGGELKILSSGYAIHAEGVFYGARRLEADGFEVLGGGGHARSRNRAYFQGEEIPGIDAASFRVFPNAHAIARDKRSVVIKGQAQARFDVASFEVLTPDGGLVRDRNHIYSDLTPIEGADPARFAWIGQGFWRDGKSLYFSSKAIAGADPDSFRLVSSSYAVDKHAVYFHGAPLAGLDPASFEIIRFIYAKDKNGVYWGPNRLHGADAESFSARIDGRGWDKSYGYRYSKRVCAWTRGASDNLPLCDPAEFGRR